MTVSSPGWLRTAIRSVDGVVSCSASPVRPRSRHGACCLANSLDSRWLGHCNAINATLSVMPPRDSKSSAEELIVYALLVVVGANPERTDASGTLYDMRSATARTEPRACICTRGF